VAIAASAGGLGALTLILGRLPATFGAPVVAVQHLDPRHRSLMAEIVGSAPCFPSTRPLPARTCRLGTFTWRRRTITCSSTATGSISLTQTELVNFVRPSADLLFESVAASYGKAPIQWY